MTNCFTTSLAFIYLIYSGVASSPSKGKDSFKLIIDDFLASRGEIYKFLPIKFLLRESQALEDFEDLPIHSVIGITCPSVFLDSLPPYISYYLVKLI